MKRFDARSTKDLLLHAAWFGLITGLVEGFGLLALHRANWLTWRLQNRAIWYETLWIAPLVDVILFGLAGIGLTLIAGLFPKLPVKKIALYAFIFLAVFDWTFIVLYGRISLVALFILAAGLSVQLGYVASRREAALAQWRHRSLPWVGALTVVLFILIQGGTWINEKVKTANLPTAPPTYPNILVIVVDTLRADHLSAYGYFRQTSPFIDRLAREGVRFEMAISPSSWTQPSHASMLTGHYTYVHQAELKPLDDRLPTIGEALQAEGYRTGAFSGNTLFFTRRQGFGRGFLHFEDNYQSISDMFFNSSLYGFIFDFYVLRKALQYEGVPTRVLASDINAAVLAWVDQGENHPFFIFVNYFDVHDPYTPPEPYRSQYASVPNPGGLINGFVERYHPELTPEQLQSEIDAYDGSINYVDDQLKNLFNELERRGKLENTLVVITADHGESLGEHGLLQHSASLYIQEIHVPLIVWWGEKLPAGRVIETPVSISALPATLLSLIGSSNSSFPGPSLEPLIMGEGEGVAWPHPIAEVAQFAGAAEQNPTTHGEMKSVVSAEWQYILHEYFGEELYDLRADPTETNNLAVDDSAQAILETFRNYLENLIGMPLFRNP